MELVLFDAQEGADHLVSDVFEKVLQLVDLLGMRQNLILLHSEVPQLFFIVAD